MLVATGCPAIYRNIYWIVNSATSNKLYIIWCVVIKKWNRIYVSQNICDCWRIISLKCWSITACIVQYNDVIMSSMASQITGLTIVYSTVYSRADQRKHQSSASLAFVRGIHRWPVNSPHKWPVTRKMFSIWWRHHGPRRAIWCQILSEDTGTVPLLQTTARSPLGTKAFHKPMLN